MYSIFVKKKEIKNEFKSSAKEASEYEEKFAFIVCESENQLNDICLNGYLCPDNSYNVIGQSKSGVYLCKYADVALKFNEVKRFPDSDSFKMIVFKVIINLIIFLKGILKKFFFKDLFWQANFGISEEGC